MREASERTPLLSFPSVIQARGATAVSLHRVSAEAAQGREFGCCGIMRSRFFPHVLGFISVVIALQWHLCPVLSLPVLRSPATSQLHVQSSFLSSWSSSSSSLYTSVCTPLHVTPKPLSLALPPLPPHCSRPIHRPDPSPLPYHKRVACPY